MQLILVSPQIPMAIAWNIFPFCSLTFFSNDFPQVSLVVHAPSNLKMLGFPGTQSWDCLSTLSILTYKILSIFMELVPSSWWWFPNTYIISLTFSPIQFRLAYPTPSLISPSGNLTSFLNLKCPLWSLDFLPYTNFFYILVFFSVDGPIIQQFFKPNQRLPLFLFPSQSSESSISCDSKIRLKFSTFPSISTAGTLLQATMITSQIGTQSFPNTVVPALVLVPSIQWTRSGSNSLKHKSHYVIPHLSISPDSYCTRNIIQIPHYVLEVHNWPVTCLFNA